MPLNLQLLPDKPQTISPQSGGLNLDFLPDKPTPKVSLFKKVAQTLKTVPKIAIAQSLAIKKVMNEPVDSPFEWELDTGGGINPKTKKPYDPQKYWNPSRKKVPKWEALLRSGSLIYMIGKLGVDVTRTVIGTPQVQYQLSRLATRPEIQKIDKNQLFSVMQKVTSGHGKLTSDESTIWKKFGGIMEKAAQAYKAGGIETIVPRKGFGALARTLGVKPSPITPTKQPVKPTEKALVAPGVKPVVTPTISPITKLDVAKLPDKPIIKAPFEATVKKADLVIKQKLGIDLAKLPDKPVPISTEAPKVLPEPIIKGKQGIVEAIPKELEALAEEVPDVATRGIERGLKHLEENKKEGLATISNLKRQLSTTKDKSGKQYLRDRIASEKRGIELFDRDINKIKKYQQKQLSQPKGEGEITEAWRMTREEYEKIPAKDFFNIKEKYFKERGFWFTKGVIHKLEVKKALSEGKTVPLEVLKNYPGLEKEKIVIPRKPPVYDVERAVSREDFRTLIKAGNVKFPESLAKNFAPEQIKATRLLFNKEGIDIDKRAQELKSQYPNLDIETGDDLWRKAIEQTGQKLIDAETIDYDKEYAKWLADQKEEGLSDEDVRREQGTVEADVEKEILSKTDQEALANWDKIEEGAEQIIIPGAEAKFPETKIPPTMEQQLIEEKGELFEKPKPKLKLKPQYSISQEDYDKAITGKVVGKVGLTGKVIPPKTATGKPIKWEKTPVWQVNLGRDIEGVFEREVGPKLLISKRLKKWLGVYYPMLGESGTIKVRSLADQQTLNHETGHYLDDVLGKFPIEKTKSVRDELVKVTKFLSPFEERYVPIIDKETGEVKRNKKTGEILKKQDSYTAYRRSRQELFAEYIALYTQNPAKAKELAPNFTARVEQEIARNTEFSYIIDKLHEYDTAFKPMREMVNSLRKIPEIDTALKDWEKKGNILQAIWQKGIGDHLWNVVANLGDKIGKLPLGREFFEKKGLPGKVFEILRQRAKLIHGQKERLIEELIKPLGKLTETEQQQIAEKLQQFDAIGEKGTDIDMLTSETRKEIALWGNEARKLGVLGDSEFWNNVGQYFPFMYSTKEFNANRAKFGYFPSKKIRASFAGFKHKMTDQQMVRKYLEATIGTFPQQIKQVEIKLAGMSKGEIAQTAYRIREELGLIKTAAYPLQKRLSQLIDTVYTVKAFNAIAKEPGIIGTKDTPGYLKMPVGKKYGAMSEQYAPESLVREVTQWSTMPGDIDKAVSAINAIWKNLKVPYDLPASTRNLITNAITSWMIADVNVLNPVVLFSGVKSFVTKDDTYKQLRDSGLYRNTYSQQELEKLAFIAKEGDVFGQVLEWAVNTFKVPSKVYGAVEDVFKTTIARYSIREGASAAQAIKLADKALFDYSSVTPLVGKLRKFLMPFVTWSSKIFPRIVEVGIRKPWKILLLIGMLEAWNAKKRRELGITKEKEDAMKPDYLIGRSALLVGKNERGNLEWIDLSYMTPWDNFLPSQRTGIPQVVSVGNPFLTLYNAYVLNYDPYFGEIAPKGLPESEREKLRKKYLSRSLGPRMLVSTPTKIYKSLNNLPIGSRTQDIEKVLSGELFGFRFIEAQEKSKIQYWINQERKKTIGYTLKKEKLKEMTPTEKRSLIKEADKIRLKKLKAIR